MEKERNKKKRNSVEVWFIGRNYYVCNPTPASLQMWYSGTFYNYRDLTLWQSLLIIGLDPKPPPPLVSPSWKQQKKRKKKNDGNNRHRGHTGHGGTLPCLCGGYLESVMVVGPFLLRARQASRFFAVSAWSRRKRYLSWAIPKLGPTAPAARNIKGFLHLAAMSGECCNMWLVNGAFQNSRGS